jgi:hypothetical protein
MAGGGRIKRGEGVLIGDAGEYAVISELLKQDGVVAALAPRNTPWFDILATKGEKTVRIRVKTKSVGYKGWQWNVRKDGKTIFPNLHPNGDFVVMVDLGAASQSNHYYIVPTHTVDQWLKDDFDAWVRQPGKRGRPHDPQNKRRILWWPTYGEKIKQHQDWEILWRESENG